MMEPAEIANPEGYCLLKIEKIEAVHGCLRLAVQTGRLNPERRDQLKNKFEELRAVLRQKIIHERKIFAENTELTMEREQQEKKLEKWLKEAKREEETAAMISEDAEEADFEASMATERAERALLELDELKHMRQTYGDKVEEIRREHVFALEPVIARIQQEIQTAGEELKERDKQLDQSRKEIEDSKANHTQLMEDMKLLNPTKFDYKSKMEDLAGKTETLKKQVDIILNAIKVSRVQLEKWTGKVGECEKQLLNAKHLIKVKKEEHVNAVCDFHKTQLHEQEQEKMSLVLTKDLETAKADAENHLNDQMYLDLQLMGKLSDLKYAQELHSRSLRQRDRDHTRLQQVHQALESLQASIPSYSQEKKNAQKEFISAEEESIKQEELVVGIRGEVDFMMRSLRKSELLGDNILKQVRQCNQRVEVLEKELIKCAAEDHSNQKRYNHLKLTCERFQRVVSEKHMMWKKTLKTIETQKSYHKGFLKREEQLNKEYQANILLYNDIRSQRNKYLRLVDESNVKLMEMEDKINPAQKQAEYLHDDVTHKMKIFNRLHKHVLDSQQACGCVKIDINKCFIVLAQKKFIARELKLERKRLKESLQKNVIAQKKMQALYAVHIKDRNKYGLNVIDRNDELTILYEKANVQADLMKFSELDHLRRLGEIALLRRECKSVAADIATEKRITPDPTALYEEFRSLKKQVHKAQVKLAQLSDLCENPLEKTKRWRQLKGHDHKPMDLERKARITQAFINQKENQATEKDIILEELTELLETSTIQGALKLVKGIELSKKLNDTVRQRITTSRAVVATISELALVQAKAMAMSREKEDAWNQLDEAQLRLAAGEPPTEAAARELAFKKRESAVVRKIESQRQALQQEERDYQEALHHPSIGKRPKTTPNVTSRAEKRPNVYLGGPHGLPQPFPVHLPFRPSTGGSVLRHFRKPSSASTGLRRSLVATKS
ncbi:uncharacterized protein [Physcomitrium patens]